MRYIFKDLHDFNKNKEKDQNGVTKEFLINHYGGDLKAFLIDNKFNKGCFNCFDCFNSTDCFNCTDCKFCTDCINCKNLIYSDHCTNCQDLTYSDHCKNKYENNKE